MFLEDHLGFPPYHPPPAPPRTHFYSLPGWTALRADRLPRSHLQFPHGLGGPAVRTDFWPAAVLRA